MIKIFVPDVPEFTPLIRAADAMPHCRVGELTAGYTVIESDQPLEFHRKSLDVKLAIWFGLFTGGLQGRIETFERDVVRVVP